MQRIHFESLKSNLTTIVKQRRTKTRIGCFSWVLFRFSGYFSFIYFSTYRKQQHTETRLDVREFSFFTYFLNIKSNTSAQTECNNSYQATTHRTRPDVREISFFTYFLNIISNIFRPSATTVIKQQHTKTRSEFPLNTECNNGCRATRHRNSITRS